MLNSTSQSNNINADQNADSSAKRNSIKFTDLSIKYLKAVSKDMIFWCEGMTGFGIKVSPKGSKTWVFQYRIDGRGRRMVIGKYPRVSLGEAIQEYGKFKKSVEMGIDPLYERDVKKRKEHEELTVKELVDLYLEHSEKSGKKSYRTEEREFKKDLLPIFGDRKITQVDSKELVKMFSHIIVVREAPSAASHLYSYVRRLFNFAADMGMMRRRDNPCLDIKLKVPKNRRQRHLKPDEVYKFWHTLDDIEMADICRLGLRFLLCTVARSIEVRKMRWSHVDLNSRIWTMPTSKNGRLHRVYLGDIAIQILKEARSYSDGKGYVFGSTRSNKTCGIVKNDLKMLSDWTFSQPIRRHFEKFNIEESFYPHDLRRTGATMIAGLFGRRDFAAMALNHTTSDVTGIYDQYAYDREKMMSLNALNKAIEIIINSPSVESVPSFEELRQKVIQPVKSPNFYHGQETDKHTGFQASSSNPVSYRLSYAHDGLKTLI